MQAQEVNFIIRTLKDTDRRAGMGGSGLYRRGTLLARSRQVPIGEDGLEVAYTGSIWIRYERRSI
jgi:hypothetical protein